VIVLKKPHARASGQKELTKPLLLDLFSGSGGAAKGYQLAGFYVIGVDIKPMPHYCGDEFYIEDALAVLDTLLSGGIWHGYVLQNFAVIHASPVCKAYSFASAFHPGTKQKHSDFIPPVRERLRASGKPYIIENVAGAPLEKAFMLCGNMFGLQIYRHRYFETNLFMVFREPIHPRHIRKAAGPGAIARPDEMWCVGGHFGHKDEAQQAMGIAWMETVDEIAQAIPPAYTSWIGMQLLTMLEEERRRP
jgi:DNA (cytosine-5)-methyltransferase 1